MNYIDPNELEPKLLDPAQRRKFAVLPNAERLINLATPADEQQSSAIESPYTSVNQPELTTNQFVETDELAVQRAAVAIANSQAMPSEEAKRRILDVPEAA